MSTKTPPSPGRKARNTGLDTPMLALLRKCTDEQRQQLAKAVPTSVNYLYAIAGCHRKKISVQMACAIETATRTLHAQTKGETPIVTALQIATMCAVAGLDDEGA
jgi:hypothetical protein